MLKVIIWSIFMGMHPIRKIAPRIVSLSSYYGKTFVQSGSKVANDEMTWLYRNINDLAYNGSGKVKDLNPGNVFDNDYVAPYLYNALASEYETFKIKDFTFIFDHNKGREYLKSISGYPRDLFRDGAVFCGYDKNGNLLSMRKDDSIVCYSETTQVFTIYSLLDLNPEEAPEAFAEVRVFSKYIPVGIAMSYYIGFRNLLSFLEVPFVELGPREHYEPKPNDIVLRFADKKVVANTSDKTNRLIIAGVANYEKITKQYNIDEFDAKDVYLNLLLSKGMSVVYLRELDAMEYGFIDPITEEVLKEMGEPTTLNGLLVRSCELLTTYHHPASQDRKVMRDRGYERFAGTIYRELTHAVKQFRNRNLVGRAKVEMSPYQVWNTIMKDNSLKIAEDINPIQNLKEQEVITFTGMGGRDKDTMTKPTRAYHKNDIGVLSESTVDSTSVGTIAYLSADPNIKSVRGLMSDEKKLNPTTILSTSALLSPAAMNDNPKRVMFIATQHSHTIASAGYRQPRVRTGYESVIGKRTSKLFCYCAEEDGVVTSQSDHGIIVKYNNDEVVGVELGRQYGRAEGSIYPHDIVTPLSAGQKFKKGDVLSYNTKFFEPDFLNPREVVLKVSDCVNVAFIEANYTHEDSCAISSTLGNRFTAEVVKLKSYVVKFGQNVSEVVKIGQKLEPNDVLMIIEDEITSQTNAFDSDALATLKRLSNISPRANTMGVVERFEIFYNGDKSDMSASIRKLADQYDRNCAMIAKASNKPVVTGRVTDEYRVSGTPLELNHLEIRIYISVTTPTGVGDKAVFGHQMKSTIAQVHEEPFRTEDGDIVEAIFAYRSVANRGVLSPAVVGTTSTLLDVIAKGAVKVYEA